ncbi:hypothetical protein EYF80_036366 [Liparis tanakae]|uniref:Uncharacterized protein n=1 Tax=Liparis tanakae TaxID=230148 RepID=A0A4Z2GJ26_9TELE|nr:hypothetical protein EYF80_036366 [Liparis tanakae]
MLLFVRRHDEPDTIFRTGSISLPDWIPPASGDASDARRLRTSHVPLESDALISKTTRSHLLTPTLRRYTPERCGEVPWCRWPEAAAAAAAAACSVHSVHSLALEQLREKQH